MIIINISGVTAFKKVFEEIETSILQSYPVIAENLANYIAAFSIIYLKQNAKHWTGRFAKSIKVLPNDNRVGFSRFDIVSDSPYFMWLEYGRSAPMGLPYSNSGKKDFSKSKFKGHHMFDKGVNLVMNTKVSDDIITEAMVSSLNGTFKGKKVVSFN